MLEQQINACRTHDDVQRLLVRQGMALDVAQDVLGAIDRLATKEQTDLVRLIKLYN